MFISTGVPSEKGYTAAECEEGRRLKAYLDSRGIPTIGVGHTNNAPSGHSFRIGDVWTAAKVDAVYKEDSAAFVKALNRDLSVAVTQQQFDALFSLEMNIGMGGLRGSHIVDVINHHGTGAVTMHDFLAWAHPSELKGRRMREWEMWSRGIYRDQ